MTTACLVLSAALAVASLTLCGRSLRRRNALHGLAGMTAMLAAGVPAFVYGALTS